MKLVTFFLPNVCWYNPIKYNEYENFSQISFPLCQVISVKVADSMQTACLGTQSMSQLESMLNSQFTLTADMEYSRHFSRTQVLRKYFTPKYGLSLGTFCQQINLSQKKINTSTCILLRVFIPKTYTTLYIGVFCQFYSVKQQIFFFSKELNVGTICELTTISLCSKLYFGPARSDFTRTMSVCP